MRATFCPSLFAGVTFISLLTACAAPRPVVPRIGYVPVAQIAVQSKFESQRLTLENFSGIAKNCMTTWPDSASQRITSDWKIPLPRGTVQTHSHNGHASYLLVAGELGICVQQSDEKHPILAAEALYKTANPGGVPLDVADQWYANIAREIARTGSATAIYKFNNGNAHVAKYWVDPNIAAPTSLSYWSEFKRAGEWTTSAADQIFTHPALASVSVTEYNKQRVKPLLSHRID